MKAHALGRTFVLKPMLKKRRVRCEGCVACAAHPPWADRTDSELCQLLAPERHIYNSHMPMCFLHAAIWVEDTEEAMAQYVIRCIQGEHK